MNTSQSPTATGEHGFGRPPLPKNEPIKEYAVGSPERAAIKHALSQMSKECIDLPMRIAGRAVETGDVMPAVMPHNHRHVLGNAHSAGTAEVNEAIHAALQAAPDWSRTNWTERASIFLKAADLLSGPWRNRLNAATMLGQSKTIYQAEIDAAAELVDFFRWNVEFMQRIYEEQPISPDGVWNRADYRPLEGFVFAITPFNFTAIGGNLPGAPALMGNTIVWKPSVTAMYSAHYIMELLMEAGLPDGVINLVYGDPPTIADVVLENEHLAGVHFTGSTAVFRGIVSTVGQRIHSYRNFPRVVGETGGKNFVVVHESAEIDAAAAAIIRSAYEYQGQKCSAASRIFVADTIWPALKQRLCDEIATIGVGGVEHFSNFVGAVIDEHAWLRHTEAIQFAKSHSATTVLVGGNTDKSIGYFVDPTLIETTDLDSSLLSDELFGPIMTAYVYREGELGNLLRKVDLGSSYALTGSVFARDRKVIATVADTLRYAAGNFYINDKPTGSIVGQQPFGGARASGTNDKAGSLSNLMRWVSPRIVKENFVPPVDYRYPFMAAD